MPTQVCQERWYEGLCLDDAKGSADVQVQAVADERRAEKRWKRRWGGAPQRNERDSDLLKTNE